MRRFLIVSPLGVVGAFLVAWGCSPSNATKTENKPADGTATASALDAPSAAEVAARRSAAASNEARRAAKLPRGRAAQWHDQMSFMGAMAAGVLPPPDPESALFLPAGGRTTPGERPAMPLAPAVVGSADVIVHSPTASGSQVETSIAANPAGTVIVAGYNDLRGFPATAGAPFSVSGVARSIDSGVTWSEVVPSGGTIGVLPFGTGKVQGDPDVKWDAKNSRFVYASIFIRPSDGLQGMSLSFSDANGANWSAPVEVGPSFITGNSADKEFIDIHPTTGRILMTWTNFPGAGSSSIRRTFSDDSGVTWSPALDISMSAAGSFVQASMPRFYPATSNAYAIWRVHSGASGELRNVGCARSTDNGATWSAPVMLDTAAFPQEDQILGVDRVNTSPSLAVDNTSGRVYAVYQRNNQTGTGDIAFRTFVGDCASGAPLLLDSMPGQDRAQFYPWVSVDQASHNVHVTFLDQDPDTSGDLLAAMVTTSTDNGTSFTAPTPAMDRSFHAGHGNDTSQPNLGDYNQSVSIGGATLSTWGATSLAPHFADGQPATSLVSPDTYFDKRLDTQLVAPLRLVGAAVAESGCASGSNGFIDPGERVTLDATITNYFGNAALGAAPIAGISGTLTTDTPGVTITTGTSTYATIAPRGAGTNATPFAFTVSSTFVPGTYIDFKLALTTTTQGSIELPVRVVTGTPGTPVSVINENFEAAVAPALPTGWTSVNASVVVDGGVVAPPWTTSATWMPGKAAFRPEGASAFAFVRMFSPIVAIPAAAGGYVTLDFDLRYNLEDEPALAVQAYDGLSLRITDQTSGATVRSVLAEAFAEKFKTAALNHFPKHLPRNNDRSYFQDMSVWSGDSAGVTHVSFKFPGEGMLGRSVQLRFEYTEDDSGDCATAGHTAPCGVGVDNVVLAAVPSTSAACTYPVVPDAGADAGNDGGVTIADSGVDAGNNDSGVVIADSGVDSGREAGVDAGQGGGPDGGALDSGVADAGDDGSGDTLGGGGCGCRTAGSSSTPLTGAAGIGGLLFGALAFLRRRRS